MFVSQNSSFLWNSISNISFFYFLSLGTKLSQTAVYNNHIRDKIIRHSDRYYGMTLDNVASLVQSLGASSVKTNYAFTPSSIYTTLKSDLKFLSSTQKNYGIITNYYRRASDHNGGHISPIVSYNEIEDSVLIMGKFVFVFVCLFNSVFLFISNQIQYQFCFRYKSIKVSKSLGKISRLMHNDEQSRSGKRKTTRLFNDYKIVKF